jgi:hypothetical protein
MVLSRRFSFQMMIEKLIKEMVPGTTTETELCCFLGFCFLTFFFLMECARGL